LIGTLSYTEVCEAVQLNQSTLEDAELLQLSINRKKHHKKAHKHSKKHSKKSKKQSKDEVEKEIEEEKKAQADEAAKNLKDAQNAAAETSEDKAPAEKAGLAASPSENAAAAKAEEDKKAANAKEDIKNGIIGGEKVDEATAKKNQEIEEHLAKAGESEADK
jgi:uncharacterized membrane protein